MNAPRAVFALIFAAAGAARADAPRDEAVRIVKEIATLCETRGLQACEPHIRGMDAIFAVDRETRLAREVETSFVEFVRKRYDMQAFEPSQLGAHVDLRMKFDFKPGSFFSTVTTVTPVDGGFDMEYPNIGFVALRRVDGIWVTQMPAAVSRQTEEVGKYAWAARIDRAALSYRRLEAEILNEDFATLNRRLTDDLAPLVVAISGKPELAAMRPDWKQELRPVVEFYRQFESTEAMRKDILARNGLAH